MAEPARSRKTERAKRRCERRTKRNYPRISLKSILYVTRIYRKAVGPKSFFFAFYRIYNSVIPTVTAILSGAAVTSIVGAIATRDFTPFIIIAAFLLGIEVLNVLLRALNSYLSMTTVQDVFIYVGEQIATKYIQIPLKLRESKEFADKFERVRDFGNSITYVSSSIVGVISAVTSLISVVIATLTISPLITLVMFLAAIPSAFLNLRLSAIERRNWREYTRDRRIAWAIEQKITNSNNALEIEMNGLSSHLVHKMVKARRHGQEQDIIERRRFLLPSFGADMLESLASFGVLIFVAVEIILEKLEIGQFLTIRTLLNQLNNNISSFFNSITAVNENLVNATDYMEFMETPSKPNGNVKITSTPKIEFKNVSFSYPNSKTKALDNVSFTLEPGQSLAIVGENGAGKTTLIKLLIGAYEPSEGVILINDEPFEHIERESYLKQLGALFQEYARYEFATLGENVWFGDVRKKYNTANVKAALRDADLDNLAARYEKGLDQILSKDFDNKYTTDLSGGQWQRLSIARAFYRSPNVLLLDEPTAAIDAEAEYKIFQNILARQKDKTTVIISHRFSTVRKAKSIVVLEKGRIIEAGTHDELIAANGRYRQMFELQAEGYN
ncbi:ABC transporter ATP-binding protein [Candidatus Saccharibacteria bacterium]|nr:ABC transporter ATP-binding protein [Candidatus Saccharibacteria bacterium]